MAKSREILLQELNALVRSGGQGGLTSAQDLRSFLTVLVDEMLERSALDSAVLEFVFEARTANTITCTIGARQVGKYQTQQLQKNVTAVTYKVNQTTVSLPFAVASGDTLEVTITREVPEQGAVVSLQN